jgi:signal transduction histidine kinase
MRISHRTRLTLATASVSGVILAALFGLAIYVFQTSELGRAHDILRPAILQIKAAADKGGVLPDLAEVVESNPQLSFGAFDLKGRLTASEGGLSLTPAFKWAYSMIGKPTHASGIEWGIIEIGNSRVVAGSITTKAGLILGVLPWKERERTMDEAALALAILWFPLVGLVGALTWVASARTFGQLETLSMQAEQFSESDLSLRLTIASQDEIGHFAARLNHFLQRIEDSVERQKRFVEDAAHEMRTPLTILRGRIETTLLSDRGGEEYREALMQVLRETERMSRLVEAMLQSALPVQDVTIPLDVETLLERAHARWLDRYIESGVQLDMALAPEKILALEEEVDCVVDNLLTNALRASPKGSTCVLAVEREGENVLLSVTDEGAGVPLDKRDAIFERFTRLEKSRNRSLGGFGVGLAVSRRLVEARNGSIRVTDGPSGGARFEVRWPAAP